MLTEAINAVSSLDAFATYMDSWWAPNKFHELIGTQWNVPPINRDDIAHRIRRLSDNIKNTPNETFDISLRRQLGELPFQISYFQQHVLPQMQSTNIQTCISILDTILGNIERGMPVMIPDTNWETVERSGQIPRQFAQRIRNLEARLNNLEPRGEELEVQVRVIADAHQAALELPTDMESLSEAMRDVGTQRERSEKFAVDAEDNYKQVSSILEDIRASSEESIKLVENISGAYHAATTSGLAASFADRAYRLNTTTWVWVGLLLFALLSGSVIGYLRLEVLQTLIQDSKVTGERLWLNAAMSFLAIAAPVWFAWLATKQIGQRFRLAEDYAFKAAVAKAYEGYRREAARLDTDLEKRLFASALDRLEEAPLRFISTDEFSSPYQEMLASPGLQRMLEKFPDVRASVLELVKRAGGAKVTEPPAS